MKLEYRALPSALLLLVCSASGFAAGKSAVSTELNALVLRIQAGIDSGQRTEASLATELQEFDELLNKHAGEHTDDVAEILLTEARLYLQMFNDNERARQLVLRLKREFPLTASGRKAPELLAAITRHEQAQRIRNSLPVNSTLPDFSEKDILRSPLTLSAYRGKVVLLQFWATWSRSSVGDIPQLVALFEQHQAGNFQIIGVSLDDDQMRLSGFTTRNKMRWPQYCDGSTSMNKLALKYGIDALPANYLLDREGKIIAKDLRGSELAKQVAAAVAAN